MVARNTMTRMREAKQVLVRHARLARDQALAAVQWEWAPVG
jgi:hypothetical protein